MGMSWNTWVNMSPELWCAKYFTKAYSATHFSPHAKNFAPAFPVEEVDGESPECLNEGSVIQVPCFNRAIALGDM